MTAPHRAILVATLALLLLAPALPLASAAKCYPLGGLLGTVCHDVSREGVCVWATQFDPSVDFGTIEKQCASAREDVEGHHVCALTIAGFGTYGGFYGVDSDACAHASLGPDGLCLLAHGETQYFAWQTYDRVCVLEPLPLA